MLTGSYRVGIDCVDAITVAVHVEAPDKAVAQPDVAFLVAVASSMYKAMYQVQRPIANTNSKPTPMTLPSQKA
jgi:hypothetical protein